MDRTFPAAQVDRGRELIETDRRTRLALGDVLVEVSPRENEAEPVRPSEPGEHVARFAAAIGLNAAQARRYRAVSAAFDRRHRDALAATGVAVGYEALSAALLRPGGSAEQLIDLCRDAAREGRTQVTIGDIETARRAVVKKQAHQRRVQRANERAERADREQRDRDQALAAYRDGIEELVAARVREGSDEAHAEAAVVREVAERIANENGNPADLLSLGSEIVDRHAATVKTVRQHAVEIRAATRRLDTAENTLRRLAGSDVLTGEPADHVDQWLATLDRIITNSVELAEQLRERRDGAQ